MWERKELKNKAKEVVKRNYWTAIIVCFLIALLTGEFGTSIIGVWQTEDTMDPKYIEHQVRIREENKEGSTGEVEIKYQDDNTQTQESSEKTAIFYEGDTFTLRNIISDIPKNILKTIDANLNSATKSQKYIFKIKDAITLFKMDKPQKAVVLCIAAAIAFAFTILIADPLIVGGKRYFIKARMSENTKIGEMTQVFKNGNWLHVAIVMFLRNIYNALWYLTIIGGIIKTYEYRMIPYLLADNPKIKRKEAFALSKQMMKGNKWKTFLLDMSFFVWNFFSVLTSGLLSIFWVNPYNLATITELYILLKEEAIEKQYEGYQNIQEDKAERS